MKIADTFRYNVEKVIPNMHCIHEMITLLHVRIVLLISNFSGIITLAVSNLYESEATLYSIPESQYFHFKPDVFWHYFFIH